MQRAVSVGVAVLQQGQRAIPFVSYGEVLALTAGTSVSESAESADPVLAAAAAAEVAVVAADEVAEAAELVAAGAAAEEVLVFGGPLGPGQPSPGAMMSYA